MRVTSARIFAIGLPLLAAACGPTVQPMCFMPRDPPKGKARLMQSVTGARVVRTPSWEEWMALILRAYDAKSGEVSSSTTDCSGEKLLWQEPEGCAEPGGAAAATPLPARPITEDDLVVARLKGDRWLVWIQLQRFDDGDALGPVALAENTDKGVAIRTIGVLRAVPKRTRLRLEHVAERQFVVAEGDRCASSSPKSCRRIIRLLMRRGQRFVARPLVLQDGTCVGPALFALGREETVPLTAGWRRRFDLSTTLAYEKDRIRIHEQVVVADSDSAHPEVPPRVFRRAGEERCVQIDKEGRLIVGGTSLWARMMRDHASVQVPTRATGASHDPEEKP